MQDDFTPFISGLIAGAIIAGLIVFAVMSDDDPVKEVPQCATVAEVEAVFIWHCADSTPDNDRREDEE